MNSLNFDETKQSQLPFVEMLIKLGYRYIPIEEVNRQRQEDTRKFILKETAFQKLSEINEYEHNGQTFKFSDKDVAEVVDELDNIPLEGLVDTSKTIFQMIMPKTGGKTIKVFHNGKYSSKSFRYINFENPNNNDFAVTVEFEASGKSNRRIDIVVFVNGIPFAYIENKKSAVEVEQAINQHLRNQKHENCPRAFIYPQLLIAANKEELRYGTTQTPEKFYSNWRERELRKEEWRYREEFKKEIDANVSELISKPIEKDVYTQILKDLNGNTYGHTQILDRLPTEQDRGVYGMFCKERLLDLCKNFVLYDGGIKKIMRYPQFFAIKKIQERIAKLEQIRTGKRREGGIVWQTQGSGKSLTMVMFVKALIEDPNIINPRVLIVTDRKDLDRQIRDTFQNAGLKKGVIQAQSGAHLLKLIKEKNLSVITTLVHKFQSASKKSSDFVDEDRNIFVLIDEAHRTQSGEANMLMNKTMPNACYIAFTGTPLLKKHKSENKFGGFIDRYTIDDALNDEIILPLIYEGRYVDLRQDKHEIDKQTKRITAGLLLKDKIQLQYEVKSKMIQDNPQRIAEIAYDIQKHYLEKFKDTGLKAQIVASSKYSATLLQKYFEQSGKVTTALVISDENGIIPEEDEHKQEVDEYLRSIKENYQSLLSYEKDVISSFKHNDGGIEILIVVDKLLTGFDAPRNTVLYLTKELRDHNLLQAIARVNRLYDNESLPKTAGYIIDYSENATNIKTAMELFGNYDEEDVKGALIDVDEKTEELQKTYSDLHDHFNGIKKDDEAFLQYLEDEPTRKMFYEFLNKFLQTFNECMILQDFVNEFDEVDTYKKELKSFLNLRRNADVRYADKTDLSKYRLSLTKIIDKNIKAEEAELLTKQVAISDTEAFDQVVGELGSDKSKAEAIAAQTKKTIEENLDNDPEFYNRFSQKIQKLLENMRAKKIADIEALKQARLIKDQVLNKKDDSLPHKIQDHSGADVLYRNLKDNFENHSVNQEEIVDIILQIIEIIKQNAVVDWYVNSEKRRIMENYVDDYLYDTVKMEKGIDLSSDEIAEIRKESVQLARNNYKAIRQ